MPPAENTLSSPLFTLIVPMFQLEHQIEKMIASVSAQTFPEFEALLIDDGSTDRTLAICRERCGHDPRFRVIARPHAGTAAAGRNFGMKAARGEYLLFLDGDDWIEPDSLQRFAEALQNRGYPDLLAARVTAKASTPTGIRTLSEAYNLTEADGSLSGAQALETLRRTGRKLICYSPLNLYRREFLLKNELFQHEEIRLLEDHLWCPQVFLKASRVAALDFAYYTYLKREESISTTLSERSLADVAAAIAGLLAFFDRHADEMSEEVKRFWADHTLMPLFWYFFNPFYQNKFTDAARRRTLATLLGSADNLARLLRLAKYATIPRRIGVCTLRAARRGILSPADFYFRRIYFPLCVKRDRS